MTPLSRKQQVQIHDIALRVKTRRPLDEQQFNALISDLALVHTKRPMDFGRLLEAPLHEFNHDIAGIQYYLDRATGDLTQNFEPRYATPWWRR